MKYLGIALSAFMLTASGNLFAQNAAPAAGIKITKITGTVQLMKDGMVVMTLKPGDALPTLVDPSMTFAAIDGSIELQADGQVITAAAGSNFTVTSPNAGEVNVSVAAGAPVQVTDAAGNSTVVAQNSDVRMNNAKGQTTISVTKGSAMVTTTSGAAPQNVQAGQSVMVAAPMMAPAVQTPVVKPAAKPTSDTPSEPIVINLPPVSAQPATQEVQESKEVSGSNP